MQITHKLPIILGYQVAINNKRHTLSV